MQERREMNVDNAWTPDLPIIRIADLYKSFNGIPVLSGISVEVAKGDVACIIGPSGSGKSTLLRCINALIPIDRGSILFEGTEVNSPTLDKLAIRKKIGMVFQQYNLFPHRTALQNIMMAPVHVLQQDPAEVEARAWKLLKKVRLEEKANSYPGELSGGQQQRVAIARALITDPKLIVADEPTGDLDRNSAADVLTMLQRLNDKLGKTIIMVTHDAHAAGAAKALVHLEKGELIDGTAR